jgi:mucin-22
MLRRILPILPILILTCLMVVPVFAQSPPAYGSSAHHTAASGTTTNPVSLTVSSGDTIMAFTFSGFQTASIGDSQSNSWSTFGQNTDCDSSYYYTGFTTVAKSTGSDTITATASSADSDSWSITVLDYGLAGNIGASSTANDVSSGCGAKTTSFTNSLTTTATNSVILCFLWTGSDNVATTYTPSAGQTTRDTVSWTYTSGGTAVAAVDDKPAVSRGSYTCSGTFSSGTTYNDWDSIMVELKNSSSSASSATLCSTGLNGAIIGAGAFLVVMAGFSMKVINDSTEGKLSSTEAKGMLAIILAVSLAILIVAIVLGTPPAGGPCG